MAETSGPVYFWRRLVNRVVWSWAGWKDAWASEHSFRTWVWANAVSDIAAFLLPLSGGERMAIVVLGILVLAAELMNTAVERVTDLVTRETHDLAGRAKDAGSAAVAVTSIAAGVAWVFVLVRLLG